MYHKPFTHMKATFIYHEKAYVHVKLKKLSQKHNLYCVCIPVPAQAINLGEYPPSPPLPPTSIISELYRYFCGTINQIHINFYPTAPVIFNCYMFGS